MSTLEKFHYQLSGLRDSPKRLVFLHGVMGFASNFRRIAKAFDDQFQTLCFDQRGHGRSFHPDHGYQPEDYAQDLLEIIDELGWPQIHLVGHSMGGRVAVHFASRHPDRVERLVIEDIGPSMQSAGTSLITRILDTVPLPFASKSEAKLWFDTTFIEMFKGEFKVQGLASYLYANLIENEDGKVVWRFSEAGVRESVASGREWQGWQEIQSLICPTLLVRGEFSKDLPSDLFELMLESNPLIEGFEVKGSGHWIHADQPEVFIQCLARFFAAH